MWSTLTEINVFNWILVALKFENSIKFWYVRTCVTRSDRSRITLNSEPGFKAKKTCSKVGKQHLQHL